MRVGARDQGAYTLVPGRFADHVTKRNGGSGDENEGGETSGSELGPSSVRAKRCDAVHWGLLKRGDSKLLTHSNLDV